MERHKFDITIYLYFVFSCQKSIIAVTSAPEIEFATPRSKSPYFHNHRLSMEYQPAIRQATESLTRRFPFSSTRRRGFVIFPYPGPRKGRRRGYPQLEAAQPVRGQTSESKNSQRMARRVLPSSPMEAGSRTFLLGPGMRIMVDPQGDRPGCPYWT